MRRFPFSKVLALIAVSTGLAACGGNAPILSTPVSAANAYLLTSNNRIIGVDLDDLEYARSTPQIRQATTTTPVDGALDMDEVILDIDYRNSEGQLYALTRKGTEGRIIRVDPRSGTIARIITLSADAADNVGESALFSGLSATASYTIDFNPVVDRLRVIGSDGSNLRVDALTGETITDTNITPAGSRVSGLAYRDDFLAAGAGRATTLFSIDLNAGSSGKVFPTDANGGVLTSPGKDLGLSASNVIAGYDINPQNNVGIAAVIVAGSARVYNIDPSATGNAASLLGVLPKLPGSETYKSLALVTTANPTVTALTNANGLVTFRALEPNLISSTTPAPGVSGDTLVGIDFRQSDRVLYGLGLSGKVYNLTAGTSSTSSTGLLPSSSSENYTLDFNPMPTANKLRLIDSLRNNYVIDVDAVSRSDRPAITSTATVTPVVAGLAYINNFRGSTVTQLLAIDRANSTLNLIAITAPTAPATTPAEGSLTVLTTLGITLDPTSPVGFDISGRNNDNQLLMARTTNTGNFTLYRVNGGATSTPLTPVGVINSSSGFIDIAIRF